MQIYVFFSIHLLPRLLNNTPHYRHVVEIVEAYLFVEVQFGVQGQSPSGVLGRAFFYFSEN
jgi:hypothetical protein